MQGKAEILERLAWIENVTPRDKATIVSAMDEIANLRDELATMKARNTRLLSQLQEHECRDQ